MSGGCADNTPKQKLTMNINGQDQEVEVPVGATILDVCRELQIEVPTLCHNEYVENYGACRLCVVEIGEEGKTRLTTSCTTLAENGLRIQTNSERVEKSRKMTVELLYSRCPEEPVMQGLAQMYEIGEPRFASRDNNCILCGLCVRMCQRIGTEAISFQNRGYDREIGTPYLEASDDCLTCGGCNFVCPTTRFSHEKVGKNSGLEVEPKTSEYEEGLTQVGNVAIYFTQAVPTIPVIDRDNCVHFQMGDGHCEVCKEACKAEAINYDQEDKIEDVEVGSVILCPGFDEFDPKVKTEYGYGEVKNVVSSIEFERIMSASGPFEGHIKRLSDLQEPKNIAFIQCVGSRDASCGNEYCSQVCCMYSIKEAIIAQEHAPGLQTEIFFMDMRAFGKEFDDYYTRAQEEYGIKFTRCRVANIDQADGENVVINYVEDGEIKQKEFDMAVLAVGLEATKTAKELSETFGIELNKYNFAKTTPFTPLETSRPGVYVSGAFNGPKDIPDTVAQASGAAAKAGSVIHEARGTMIAKKEYPPERDTTQEEPRVGVFICHCGINIGGVVDVPAVAAYAETIPGVVYSMHNIYTCSQDTNELIKEKIIEHKLNRVIVASCSPRTHEPLFRSTCKEAGINPYLFEMANIRDQCSWVHMQEPEEATEKAKDLVRMAIAKAKLLEPLYNPSISITQQALVIGGGLAGMTAALDVSANGFKAHLVEKENVLGGNLRNIYYELGNVRDPQEFLKETIEKVNNDPNITVHMETTVAEIEGFMGNFSSKLSDGTQFDHGAIIVATGALEYKPTEYLYGQNPNVVTQKELEKKIATGEKPEGPYVMIQCVGCRNEERPYCSRVCCANAVKNALKIKELDPTADIYVLYKDIRTYGFREDFYQEAASKGVKFIRYDDENMPIVADEGGLSVKVVDPVLKQEIEMKPGTLILSAATIPPIENNEKLATMMKVPLTKDKFFLEAHMKLRPVDFATEGIYLCGLAHNPKFIDETISQASGAVARAVTVLSKDTMELEPMLSQVIDENCDGCAYCVDPCPYAAIQLLEYMHDGSVKKIVSVNEALCKGCGVCMATCPKKGIEVRGFKMDMLNAMIDACLEVGQ